MFKTFPVKRAIIDAWPTAAAGLGNRAAHALAAAGLQTVGQLRARLAGGEPLTLLPGMGSGSAADVTAFFDRCARLEAGHLAFRNLDALFLSFMDRSALRVLTTRHGLRERVHPVSRPPPLASIGRRVDRSRERIRQIQREAEDALGACLARACLETPLRRVEAYLATHGGSVTAAELQGLRHDPLFRGWNPAAIARLFALFTGRPGIAGNVFSALPAPALASLAQRVEAVLAGATEPLPPEAIARRALATPLKAGGEAERRRAIACLVRDTAGLAETADGRFATPETAVEHLAAGVLADAGQPLPLRAILREVNARLTPSSRCGRSVLLRALGHSPRIRRLRPGHYESATTA